MKITTYSIALLMGACVVALVPQAAFAFGPTPGATCPAGGQFLGFVVPCIQNAIIEATDVFLAGFVAAISPAILAFVLLVVTLFGVRVATGENEINKKTIALILKIGVVFTLFSDFGAAAGLGPAVVFGAMQEGQELVLATLPVDTLHCQDAAFQNTAAATGASAAAWGHMDCLVGRIFGYGGAQGVLGSSVFGLVGSALFSGSMGAMMFFLGLGMFLSILFFALRSAYMFLLSYLYIAFLIVISPMLIPLMLMNITTQAFEVWFRSLMAAMALPLVIFGFLSVALPIIDLVIFDPDPQSGSLQSLLGDESFKTIRLETTSCNVDLATKPETYTNYGLDPNSAGLNNFLNPVLNMGGNLCSLMRRTSVDFGTMHSNALMLTGIAILKIMVVCYLLLQVEGKIPTLTSSMFGGGFSLTEAMDDDIPIQGLLRNKVMAGHRAMTESLKGGSGGVLAGGRGDASAFMSKGIPSAMSGFASKWW